MHPVLEQHEWEAQRHKPPVAVAVGARAHPHRAASVSAQLMGPKPCFPTAAVMDLSV